MNTININALELAEALQKVVGVVERKQTMPHLSHILLYCSSNRLTMTATDLEVQLSCDVENVSYDGELLTTIPGRKAFEIIKSLGNKEIELGFSETSITIRSSNSRFKLQSLSANEFPLFDATGADTSFVAKQKDIHKDYAKFSK